MSTDKRQTQRVYYSYRDLPLLYVGDLPLKPVLTLENYCKWYGVQLINTDGSVSNVDPDVMSEVSRLHPTALLGDHGFTPHFLYRLAEHLNARMDDRAIEVAGARWLLEQEDMGEFFYPPR